MTVNEAIRIMRARAPVVTCTNTAAALWRLGHIRYQRIKSVTLIVTDKGKFDIYVNCVGRTTPDGFSDSLTQLGLDDIELAPDCPEILRKMIYKDKTTVSVGESPGAEDDPQKESKENAPLEPAAVSEPPAGLVSPAGLVPETAKESPKKKRSVKKEDIPTEPAFISIILNDKSYFDVPVSKVEKWKELYPAVDVEQELRKMSDWAESNPTKRKTRTGILSFISRWLAKEQNKGGSGTKAVTVDRSERSFDLDEFDRFTLGIG